MPREYRHSETLFPLHLMTTALFGCSLGSAVAPGKPTACFGPPGASRILVRSCGLSHDRADISRPLSEPMAAASYLADMRVSNIPVVPVQGCLPSAPFAPP